MHISLKDQVKELYKYYSEDRRSKKDGKLKKLEGKQRFHTKELQIFLKPTRYINPELVYQSENALSIMSTPDFQGEQFVGDLRCSFESYSRKVKSIANNGRFLQVFLETHPTVQMPIIDIMEQYKSYNQPDTQRTVEILNIVKCNQFQSFNNEFPHLFADNWADYFLKDEPYPSTILQIELKGTNVSIGFVFNPAYVALIGLPPDVLTDAIFQYQKLPQLIQESELHQWNERVASLLKCYKTPVITENSTMIMTYEGMQVGVMMRKEYQQSFCPKRMMHVMIEKTTFRLNNPHAQQVIFDAQRILKNSDNYLKSNMIKEVNINVTRQLEDQFIVKTRKILEIRQCGFKLRA